MKNIIFSPIKISKAYLDFANLSLKFSIMKKDFFLQCTHIELRKHFHDVDQCFSHLAEHFLIDSEGKIQHICDVIFLHPL